jgi:hypothetical protein
VADSLNASSGMGVADNMTITGAEDLDDDMKLADLVFAVMSKRGNLIENNVRNQVKKVSANNERMRKINDLITKVSLKDQTIAIVDFADPEGAPNWITSERAPLTQDDQDLLADCGVDVDNLDGFSTDDLWIPDNDDYTKYHKEKGAKRFLHGYRGDAPAKTISDALQKQASSLSTTSQTDMTTLQSLMGKYNNVYDALSNFINKYGQSLGTTINNVR